MNLYQKIEQIAILNRGSKGVIANYIIQNSRDITKYTVDLIAEKTFTSKASVVRFAKNLGFTGWREFIAAFADEQRYLTQHSGDIDANFPFKADDSTPKVIQNIQKLQEQTISTTSFMLNQKELEKAADLITQSKTTVFYAESPNNYLAELLKRKLLSIGHRSTVFKDDEAGLETGTLTSQDCAIIISYSGTQDSRAIRHINLLKSNHVPVIGITSDTDNYLREHADIGLLIDTEENLYTKIASFQTETSILFILDVLFALVFKENYDHNQYYHLDSARYLELKRKNKGLHD